MELKFCRLVLQAFYVMQQHHPTPQIIDLEKTTLTGAAVTPSYEHTARRTDVVKPIMHYDTE